MVWNISERVLGALIFQRKKLEPAVLMKVLFSLPQPFSSLQQRNTHNHVKT